MPGVLGLSSGTHLDDENTSERQQSHPCESCQAPFQHIQRSHDMGRWLVGGVRVSHFGEKGAEDEREDAWEGEERDGEEGEPVDAATTLVSLFEGSSNIQRCHAPSAGGETVREVRSCTDFVGAVLLEDGSDPLRRVRHCWVRRRGREGHGDVVGL